MIQRRTVRTWDELVRQLKGIEGDCAWAARGEPQRYARIVPSLDRVTPRWSHDLEGRLFTERVILQRFQDQGQLSMTADDWATHMPMLGAPQTAVMLLRHYGGPTRLLDWTDSLWIAAYFACCQSPDKPAYIHYFDRYQLTTNVGAKYGAETNAMWTPRNGVPSLFHVEWVKRAHQWIVCFHLAGPRFPRLSAQQGFFTLASKPYLNHWMLVRRMLMLGQSGCGMGTIKISAAAKPRVLQGLSRMNLTAATLSPGLDGLGLSLSAFAGFSHLDIGIKEVLGHRWRRPRKATPPPRS
jgi:hypothetical protein